MLETLKREVTQMAERKTGRAIQLGSGSVNVTIPRQYAKQLKIQPGTNLVFEVIEEKLVITNLDELLMNAPTEVAG